MKNEEFVKGLAIGFFAGTLASALLTKSFVKAWIKQDKLIAVRNKAIFTHMVETMGPYVPQEVLEENHNFMQFQAIITEEEGRS